MCVCVCVYVCVCACVCACVRLCACVCYCSHILCILYPAYVELAEEAPGNAAAAALGFMNIIQWTIAAAFPVIMVN